MFYVYMFYVRFTHIRIMGMVHKSAILMSRETIIQREDKTSCIF